MLNAALQTAADFAHAAAVDLGVLTLTKVVPNSAEVEKKLLFVPTNLTAGIELSDDPLPSVRAAAYGVSFGRRSQ
jgi:catalase